MSEIKDLDARRSRLTPEQRAKLDARLKAQSQTATTIPRRHLVQDIPLSPSQRGLWLTWTLDPDNPAYNMPGALHLKGQLNIPALESSLKALVARHETLRTVIQEDEEGDARQCVLPDSLLDFYILDLRDATNNTGQQALADHLKHFAQQPFNLHVEAPFRAVLFQTAAHEYCLGLCLHHIAGDGWSIAILINELFALYESFQAGREPSLPALPIQFSDYVVWQKEWFDSKARQRQLDYWTRTLQGQYEPITLPSVGLREPNQHQREARYAFSLSPMLSDELRGFARAQGVSLYVVMLALLKFTLYRFSSQSDIRVGAPVANRQQEETHGLVGYLLNLVVLRTQLNASDSFATLLTQVRDTMIGAQSHQELPFDVVVDALQPERIAGVHPLFQVKCTQQDNLVTHRTIAGLDINIEFISTERAHFDLSLDFTDRVQHIECVLIYAADLLDVYTITDFANLLQEAATQFISAPDLPLALFEFSNSSSNLAGHKTISLVNSVVDSWQKIFSTQSTKVAIQHNQKLLSYAELDHYSNQLAAQLVKFGVVAETRVAIHAERSIEFVAAVIAVLKAGGTYVPLDPALPAERLVYQIQDSGAALLLSADAVAWNPGVPVLLLNDEIFSGTAELPAIVIHPQQAAYVIYTSGSTGKPKGVVVSHGALANYVQALLARLSLLDTAQSMAMVSTVAADLGNTVLFGALCSGRTLHLISSECAFDPDAFASYMHQHRVDVLKIVPSHLQALLNAANPEWVLPETCLIVGGETTRWSLLKQIEVLKPACRVLNHYGPTETTVGVLTQEAHEALTNTSGLPIGIPLDNNQAYVLDAELNPVPLGVAGELYVGGNQVARGYQSRANQTAERFIASPFDNGERLYRTGDRVRMLKDNSLEFLGRVDDQIKVRGYRVELREIAQALRAQSGVAQAEVIARENDEGRTKLYGYVVAQPDALITAGQLRDALRHALPDYMVPDAIQLLESLPLTANGKLDRKALPDPEQQAIKNYIAPEGEAEEMLAQIWCEVLGVDQVGRYDNFFALGGDSILSLKVVARARKRGLTLAPKQLFEQPSLMSTAQAMAHPASENKIVSIPVLSESQRKIPLPLSYAQSRQWFLWQLDPDSTAYHISGALRLKGDLDVIALKQSFTALGTRHESLRTFFRMNEHGSAEQVIVDEIRIAFDDIDFSERAQESESAQEKFLQAEISRLQHTPFDLENDSLLRVGLIRQAVDEYVLILVMHHIISDGWSMQVLIDEFAALYNAIKQGKEVQLPLLPIQYADYALWQKDWLDAGEKNRQLAYWVAQLGDKQPVLQLPTDHTRRADGRYQAASCEITLSAELVQGLRRLAHEENATLYMLLLTGFQLLLNRYTGQQDIRIGVPIANRHRVETEGLVGFFVNTQVIRNVIGRGMTLRNVLAATREAALKAQEYQDLPFEHLVEALQPERSLGHNPLFQIAFNHVRDNRKALKTLPDLILEEQPLEGQAAQFELALHTREFDLGHIKANFTYAKELFEPASVARMAGHYLNLLRALVQRPDNLLSAIDLLDIEESARLHEWSNNLQHYADFKPVHQLFEQQANLQPNAIALLFGDQQLSYAELNSRANQLAHHLITLGIKPEARVGIAVERSIDMVVGLLAIVKAGGAYVPLDPEYPQNRLASMVEDSGIELLLLQSHLRELLPVVDSIPVIELDTLDISEKPTHNPLISLHGDNLVYVIYTSGSTGKPKGAANRHCALYNRLMWMQEAYALGVSDTVLQKTPFSFDVSVWEFFWPLMVGARLALAGPGDHRDPTRLIELINFHQVTTIHFVPSMLQFFLAHEDVGSCQSVERLICSGEALPADVQNMALTLLPQAGLHNLYGPTEAAIDVTHWTCRADGKFQVPIGQPISGIRTLVLDDALNLAPQGIIGELYLGGIGLGRGYLQRPSLTAERFIADPQSAIGERLYRTGDLARWRMDGQLEYLGRVDHQVKIRGFRIELGEVEARLLEHAEVREAVVIAQESPTGARLFGYVSLHPRCVLECEELLARLGEVLPDYMVPGAIVVMDHLPLNANGKVDRNALPAPDFVREHDYVSPVGSVEEVLARVWSEILGVTRVGRNDNFFELGGHSLLALKLREYLRIQGWTVSVRTLFQHPRLMDFANAIEHESICPEVIIPPNRIPAGCQSLQPDMLTLVDLTPDEIRSIEATVPGGAANIQDIYPLAPLQEGLLFHHILQPENDAYVTSRTLGFDTRERLERFIESFNRAIARHDILRTAVLWENLREPVQVVYRQAELSVQWANHHCHIDVRRAPMFQALARQDSEGQRYMLQIPSHHLVLDHATLEHLIEEIALIQQGREAELPAPVPFRDFVAQAKLGISEAEHETFFSAMLADVDEPTLPFGLADVQGNGAGIDEMRLPLDENLALQIRQQAQRYGVGAAALFHLAWALVTGKASGRDDVVFGTVLFGRMQGQQGVDRALGLFINTLPLRVEWSRQNVKDTLLQVHTRLTDLIHHEHARLSLAVRCSGVPNEIPLFSSLLNYRYSRKIDAEDMAELWEGMEVLNNIERTNYPFGMSVSDFGTEFELIAQVDKNIGAARVWEMMRSTLVQLTKALAENPDCLVCELNVLSGEENKLLGTWTTASNQYLDATTEPVHYLFEQHAFRQPEAIALVFGQEQLSYAELNRRVNQLAHYLIGLGVKAETKIGIAVDRSLDMVVGLLGILKAGGAYVPLDPDYPRDRLAYMVEDSGIELLLQAHIHESLPVPESVRVIELGALDLGDKPDHNPQVPINGASLAYVIYTSGSTGKPKGAQLCHHNVSRLLSATDAWFQFGSSDVWTLFHSYAFDFSVWEIFGALCTGGRLVVVPFWVSRSPEDFLQLLREQQVTVLNQTPSAFGQLVQMRETYDQPLALRLVIFGGEALEPERLRPWIEHWGDEQPQLINMYGITETTVHVTYRRITREDLTGQRSPVGVAIPDLGLRVLDGALNAVPIGVAGELYVAGAGLARGYLNRPALTAERFIADPEGIYGERLYRTGDLVRWNKDGQLDYLGRIDHQVKIRGFRIELGEVEAQLLVQPEVRESIVIAREGQFGMRLVGYVSLHDGHRIDSSELRSRLGAILPDYMVPGALVVMEQLPLNANGKIDRKALPEPEFASGQYYEAPQNPTEETLAQIWAEVLGVERVGRYDNFFELGGHSLLALKLVEAMRRQGRTVQVRMLFQHPQLADFAQTLEQNGDHHDLVVPPNRIPEDCKAIQPEMVTLMDLTLDEIQHIETAVPGGASNIQDIYPLVPLQEGLLFHHMLRTDGDAYVTAHTLRFDNKERMERFIDSFNLVIARHDILRTAVLWESLREPVQVVYREARLHLEWFNFSHELHSAGHSTIHVDPDLYPIDVRQAPMFRAVATHDPANQCWLLKLFGHHMVDDNTTLQQLVREIALIQQGRQDELPVPLPFRDFVAQAKLGVSEAEHTDFFSAMLGDVAEPTVPFGLVNVQGDGVGIDEGKLLLEESLALLIRRQAQRYGVSAAALFHLAWALVVGHASGKSDVVFGTVLFGRMQGRAGAERALGLFINTLPIRVQWRAEPVEGALREVHRSLTNLVHHEHARLSQAVRCSALSGEVPLFTSLLNYRHTRQMENIDLENAWEGMESLESMERTNYPLGMSVNDMGEAFELVAQVDQSVGATHVCEMMQRALVHIAEALVEYPDRPVSELNLIDKQGYSSLLEWGINNCHYPEVVPVHRSFEEQTALQPEATALLFDEEQLSYAELNRRSNQLAHYLISVGVKPETRVGIAVERSIDMVVGLLGILKAGGAYVPLDLEYPQDRLAYMIEDSGIERLLLQRHLRDQLPIPDGLCTIQLEDKAINLQPAHNPQVPVSGDNLAYVIYTSGSTGKPKGAANRHISLGSCMQWMQDSYGLTPADTVLHKAAFGFDVSAWELFWPLTSGARLALARPGDHRDPARIIELIRQHRVTTLNFVPVMLQAFLAQEGIEHQTNLRFIICGGEAMPAATQEEALARLQGASLQNLYGPTEAAIHVTRWTCRADGKTQVPIGRPISGVQTWVLDGNLNPVPPGVAGELYLGGINLGRGYLNRPSLTAERFIADPQSGTGERLYRTGDLVRWNAEGQLEYLGRIDHQVKIRGFRIELGEVEAQLLEQPEVRESVVVAQEGPAGSRLVGYVSLHAANAIDAPELRARLAAVLPDYMVPSAIVVMDRLPLNANGKVDRKALPVQDFVSEQVYEAPQGEAEETLAQIWAEVLGVERVGRNDNFFELGGNSLAAMRVVAEVRRHCGISTPLRSLFEFPVLKELVNTESAFANVSGVSSRATQLAEMELLLAEVE